MMTLRKHFEEELELGAAKANTAVAQLHDPGLFCCVRRSALVKRSLMRRVRIIRNCL